LFAWEEQQYRDLLEIIAPFVPSGEDDKWLWLGDDLLGFTVNSAYLLLVAEYRPRPLRDPVEDFVFKHLWKCGPPTKVCAFSWQLILDRIQTKDNLLKRRIIQVQHGNCSLCGETSETGRHLFLHCRFVAKVWYDIIRWVFFSSSPCGCLYHVYTSLPGHDLCLGEIFLIYIIHLLLKKKRV
jgi:hypothetical protein